MERPQRERLAWSLSADVFDADEADHQVLVFGCVHVGSSFVGGGSDCFFDVVEHVIASSLCVFFTRSILRSRPNADQDMQVTFSPCALA